MKQENNPLRKVRIRRYLMGFSLHRARIILIRDNPREWVDIAQNGCTIGDIPGVVPPSIRSLPYSHRREQSIQALIP